MEERKEQGIEAPPLDGDSDEEGVDGEEEVEEE